MKNIRQLFHLLSYFQYPLVLIAFFLLIKPLLKGFEYLSLHPEYLFDTYSIALTFLGLSLSFSALQDPDKTSLWFERTIWKNSRKAKGILFTTMGTSLIFFAAGLFAFIASESFKKEFAYGSIVLAIGLLGYLKFQLDIFDKYRKERESSPRSDENPPKP